MRKYKAAAMVRVNGEHLEVNFPAEDMNHAIVMLGRWLLDNGHNMKLICELDITELQD